MNRKLKLTLGGVAAIAAIAGGAAAIAAATGGDDGSGHPITGPAFDHAKRVALQATGGGTVTATELRDEEGYYEVEVRRDDGSQVDVHLDRNFNVIDTPADGGESGDGGQG